TLGHHPRRGDGAGFCHAFGSGDGQRAFLRAGAGGIGPQPAPAPSCSSLGLLARWANVGHSEHREEHESYLAVAQGRVLEVTFGSARRSSPSVVPRTAVLDRGPRVLPGRPDAGGGDIQPRLHRPAAGDGHWQGTSSLRRTWRGSSGSVVFPGRPTSGL